MILFVLGHFCRKDSMSSIDHVRFCEALKITERTLNQRLGDLRNEGYTKRGKNDGLFDHLLTEKGVEEYRRLMDEIYKLELVPDLHGVLKRYKMRSILSKIRDPFISVKIIQIVSTGKPYEIFDIVGNQLSMGSTIRENAIFEEMARANGGISYPLDHYIRSTTFVGYRSDDPIKEESYDSRNEILYRANLLRRTGRVKGSLRLYMDILSADRIDPGCWISCIVGVIQCTKALEGPEIAIALCNKALEDTSLNASHRAYILKTKADILSDICLHDQADEAYILSLRISRAEKLKVLKTLIMNNMGVNWFRCNKRDEAEKAWRDCRRSAQAHRLPWIKTLSEINLSDIYALKGMFRTAKDLLRSARSFMLKVGDMEGVSEVDFNLALMSIAEGKRERALDHFRKCEEFPLVYRAKALERREVMRERFEGKGWGWKWEST